MAVLSLADWSDCAKKNVEIGVSLLFSPVVSLDAGMACSLDMLGRSRYATRP